jgi:SnoaL-like domain
MPTLRQSLNTILFLILGVVLASEVYAQQTQQDSLSVHAFVDQWHRDAAEAKATSFFGALADDAVYIGTADFERWTKAEFVTFAKPYFDRGKAWDFKPYDRSIHFSADGRYAWFSELLTTWMGTCRGSGVVVRTSNGWRITQYHLSVTVPNDIIGDFIKLVDGYNSRRKK